MNKNLALFSIHSSIESEIKQLNLLFRESFTKELPLVREVLEHIILKGKRIRPILLFLIAKCYGAVQTEALLKSAFAVELIHTASLLHDDVVDQTKMRRGKKTANTIWGNKEVVLVGDHLFTQAFVEIASLTNHRANIQIARACKNLTTGEVLQLENEGNNTLSLTNYIKIIYYKTASLFETSAFLGALFSDGNLEKSAEFGKGVGIVFQIMDDILDYFGSQTGKDIGTDFREKKTTLPIILLKEKCNGEEMAVLQSHFTAKQHIEFDWILQTMNKYGIKGLCINFMKKYIEELQNFIESDVKSRTMKKTLKQLLNFAISRTQ